MQLHLAAMYANGMDLGGELYNKSSAAGQAHRRSVQHVLESYHYFNKPEQAQRLRIAGERVFLDSGAFSAWSMGVKIDLPKYCRFILDNQDCFTVASVLDVIGSAEGTYYNQKEMERLGTRPIPCWHWGEPIEYGQYYANNYEYMALGGFGVTNRQGIRDWLDMVWEKVLCDGAGRARCKVHGFAMTAVPLMARYPWYSVDSSSWVQVSSVGKIMHPDHDVIVLGRKNSERKVEGQHFDTFSPIVQQRLIAHFRELGYDLEELKDSYLSRRNYCIWSYMEMARRINANLVPFINEQPGLF